MVALIAWFLFVALFRLLLHTNTLTINIVTTSNRNNMVKLLAPAISTVLLPLLLDVLTVVLITGLDVVYISELFVVWRLCVLFVEVVMDDALLVVGEGVSV